MGDIPIYSDMLQNFYMEKFDRLHRERKARLEAVDSPEAALGYVSWVRETVRAAFGPMPERTALNARVTAVEECDGVIVEAVLFESRPGFIVSALFYRPSKAEGKLPGVVGLCGHSGDGKACDAYRAFCRTLAKSGFAVVMPDPVGQGERLQFLRTPGEGFSGDCCIEHNQLGKMLGLFGDQLARWRVFDAMRSLDYLVSRPEVDDSCLGVTGNSGGGTLSSYLWALDDRLTMAAPGCYITTFRRNFDNELPVDAEQAIPGLAAAGFEMADFLIARAPQPCLILGKSNDFFDPRGTREAFGEVRQIYELLGAGEKIALHVEAGDHGYTPGNREAMYRFFGGEAGKAPVLPEPEAGTLVNASPEGQVNLLPGSRTLPELLAERCAAAVEPLAVEEFVRYDLGLAAPPEVPDYKVLRNGRSGGRVISVFGVRSEPGILAFLHTQGDAAFHLIPKGGRAHLVVAGRDAESELPEAFRADDPERTFTLDVRGWGKSRPLTSDRGSDVCSPYGVEYFYDAAGLMLDSPLFCGRARDVLAVLALLRSCGYGSIKVTGRGFASLFTAFACRSAPELWDELIWEDAPESMRELVKGGVFRHPQSFAPRGMLRHFDLPELRAELNRPFFVKRA